MGVNCAMEAMSYCDVKRASGSAVEDEIWGMKGEKWGMGDESGELEDGSECDRSGSVQKCWC